MTKLAVITPQLGTVSETFIRRHLEDLCPGNTVAIARHSTHDAGGRWEVPCPTLFLDKSSRRFWSRLSRRLGLPERLWLEKSVGKFLRQNSVSIVLGEYLDQFLEFVPTLNRLNIPYVVQGHGIDLSAALRDAATRKRFLEYKTASAILTRCEFHRRRLIELGLPANLIHINPGGVDIPAELTIREPSACTRFLAVGRMVPKKGPIYLLEAFRLAAEQDASITLDYIGDGEMYASAKQFVDATGMANRIRCRGRVSDEIKCQLWGECQTFLQHSLTDPETGDEEGLPAAIQEAMAAGMLVISTAHSGIPEAIEDGTIGLLVPERDVAGMATAILRVARGQVDAAGMIKAGYNKAKSLYSWDAERGRLLATLRIPSMT